MNPAELQQPILDSGGIRSINFFNGRLLTARDLTREQAANREVDKRLGQAIGDGVAHGFEVSKSQSHQSTTAAPLLTIAPGLAINRRGQTLRLESETDIALVRDPNSNTGASSSFGECVPLQAGTYKAGAGVYLLTVSPAQSTEGLATVAGLDRGIASCNTDTIVSTLQFRLVQLNPPLTERELDDENHLRNVVAYKCFGVEDLRSPVSDPFGAEQTRYGLIDSLRQNRLTDCDVPLAVFYWTFADGVKFIDMWSVRRRLVQRNAGGRWGEIMSDRRAYDGEAMILQFSEQMNDIPTAALETLVARTNFNFLPPAGILRVARERSPGIIVDSFFGDLPHREPEFIDSAHVRSLLREAVNHEPIDLSKREMVWLYKVWQNDRDFRRGIGQPFVIFTSAHMPYMAKARFDVSYWNFSNFSTPSD